MKRELAFGLSRLSRGPLLRFLAWSVPEAAPAAVLGLAVARSLDDGFLAGRADVALSWLGVVLAAGLAGAAGSRFVLRALGELVEPVRDELVRRVVGASLFRAVEGKPDDGAVARLTKHVEQVRDAHAGLLLTVRGSAVAIIAAAAGLFSLSHRIALLILPPFLVGLAAFAATLGLSARWQRAAALADERLGAAASEVLPAIRDVVASGTQEDAAAMVHRPIAAQAAAERALARSAMLRTACFVLGGWAPLLLLLVYGKGFSAGELTGGLTYVLFGLQPAFGRLMSGVGGGGLRYLITLGRLLDLPLPPPRGRARVDGHVLRLRGVGFAYGEHSRPVLSGLDLVIPAGDHLAIIGPSGVGKSTLAAVLCGQLRPSAGTVELGAPMVLIPQQAYVFTGTLRENLCYLAPGASPEPAITALGLEDLVRRLGGLDEMVEPANLSAGERQLVALARAYLSEAPIAVLDEATCHLDPATETIVEQAFSRRTGTLVVIAHRLSSALRARRVLVLDGDDAVVGEHADLLRRSALYRRLISTLSPEPTGSPRSLSGSRSWPSPATGDFEPYPG